MCSHRLPWLASTVGPAASSTSMPLQPRWTTSLYQRGVCRWSWRHESNWSNHTWESFCRETTNITFEAEKWYDQVYDFEGPLAYSRETGLPHFPINQRTVMALLHGAVRINEIIHTKHLVQLPGQQALPCMVTISVSALEVNRPVRKNKHKDTIATSAPPRPWPAVG